jgi:hypothetical protein
MRGTANKTSEPVSRIGRSRPGSEDERDGRPGIRQGAVERCGVLPQHEILVACGATDRNALCALSALSAHSRAFCVLLAVWEADGDVEQMPSNVDD